MSEVLRDLVVSLSLDGDNFSRNLTSINKQIQEAKSEFRRAASGVDNFEKSVSGTQSQLSGLQQKLALQQKAVKQYERALEAANKKLENAYNRQGKLTESLDVAKQKNADLKQQVTAATKQYERFSRELGESDSATLAAKANLDALSQEYADSSAEVKKLEGQLAANTKSLQNNADAVTKARINLNNAQGALRQTEQQIRTTTERLARMQSAWTKAGDTLTAFGKKCASVSASMEKLGKGMTATLTTPVLALGTAAIKASVEYESAFASVRKTVDATETEYGQLSDAVKKMSTEVATDATDIAEVMANAGQLGTLMRATNATELFSEAQQTATSAWKDNVALSSEAGKRYATTESKLKNLKNTAVLAAQRIGDDLNPTVQRLIDGASDLIEKFMSLDESQRLMIIKFAAIAAAAGPAILVFSKIVKGVGTVSTGIGKFALTVAKAGGGWKGFLSVLSKSPAAWIAVAAAVIAATVALADYVSGAKQAREALQGMEDTARQWKDTAAETFYGQSEGLSFFGLDSGSFTRETKSAREWLQGVLAVWTDGKKETNEIVREWTDSFKELTASTRSELEEMRETAQTAGYTSVADQLSGDIDKLDAMDAEISRLLKKRQNGYFSDKDKIRLQELIDAREAIEIKYHLSAADTDGFEQIGQKLQAEIARAQAAGKPDADVTVYENAVKAAAEGMGAINTQLAEQYDKEFAIIQLISDETERQQALDQLNAKYNSDRLAAAQQYAQTLASIIMPVWQQEDIQGAAADIDTLTQKLREYSAADESEKPGILEDINEITAAMDEGAVTEYIALLMQVQSLLDSGMTEAEVQSLFPELDFSGAMDQIAAIQTFLTDRKNLLPGLESMFSEAIPDEVLKIATDLDMTGAQARWAEFAQNPGAITTEAIISGYGQQEGVEPPKLETVITISGYDLTAYRQFLADNPIEVEGVLRLSEVFQNPEDALKAENVTFWQNGVEIPASLVPKELLTPDKVAVLDEDGTMHILITPKIEGTAESVSAAGEKLDASFVTTSVFGKTSQHDWGALNGLLGGSLIDWMHSFTAELKAFDNYKGSWVTLWGLLDNNTLNGIDKRLNEQFSADNIAGLQTFVSEMVTAIQNGAEVSEEDLQKLQTIVDFLSALELAGVGENITAGIGDAMTAAGWDADAESVAGNLEAALNAAFVIHSPSQRVRPIGENVTAGVGEGMADYDLSADAEALAEKVRAAIETALPADALTAFGNSAVEGLSGALTGYSMAATGSSVATNVKSAMSGSLNASTLRPVGVNAMAGLKAGILAGRSGVISAMRSVARDAVNAAKRELKIKSPSGVFRDEVGRMAMRGFGQGALLESKNQAKVIQNAARYLTGAAQGGIGGANSYDNRKTYNQNASTTIQVDKLVVRDEQDVRSLAIEIAGLTKRQQRGKGMRFA
ncbi:MAG: phage tail tape measure protein [Clostridiales bacterium]|nr:phage tail tape measure protein [Clostridiales bacterium]